LSLAVWVRTELLRGGSGLGSHGVSRVCRAHGFPRGIDFAIAP